MITIPTLRDLYNGIKTDLETEYGSTISIFGKVWLRAHAGVQAAKLKIYYLSLGKVQKNIFIDTADREAAGGTLERFGRVKMGRDPFPATQGQYAIEVTGTTGAVIPANTVFKSDDSALNPGKLYILDTAYTMIAGTNLITIRALEAGIGSKLVTTNTLTATAPIINVDSAAVVTGEAVAPQAEEDIEDYRQKGIASFRLEPQGGAAADYRIWGLDASGVKQIYPYAASGAPNEVNVYVEATIADSTDSKGTPSSTIITAVGNCIELDPDTTLSMSERGRRPITVFAVNVLPITVKNIDIKVTGYSGLTSAKEATILAAMTEAIAAIRPFIPGADVLADRNDYLDVNKIITTIITAIPGSIFTSVELKVNSVVTVSQLFDEGNIPFLNGITYV